MKSLEETVGAALHGRLSSVLRARGSRRWAPGADPAVCCSTVSTMQKCLDRAAYPRHRTPTMYRIGWTMTGGFVLAVGPVAGQRKPRRVEHSTGPVLIGPAGGCTSAGGEQILHDHQRQAVRRQGGCTHRPDRVQGEGPAPREGGPSAGTEPVSEVTDTMVRGCRQLCAPGALSRALVGVLLVEHFAVGVRRETRASPCTDERLDRPRPRQSTSTSASSSSMPRPVRVDRRSHAARRAQPLEHEWTAGAAVDDDDLRHVRRADVTDDSRTAASRSSGRRRSFTTRRIRSDSPTSSIVERKASTRWWGRRHEADGVGQGVGPAARASPPADRRSRWRTASSTRTPRARAGRAARTRRVACRRSRPRHLVAAPALSTSRPSSSPPSPRIFAIFSLDRCRSVSILVSPGPRWPCRCRRCSDRREQRSPQRAVVGSMYGSARARPVPCPRDLACWAKMSRISAIRSMTLTLTMSSRWTKLGRAQPHRPDEGVRRPFSSTMSRSSSGLAGADVRRRSGLSWR